MPAPPSPSVYPAPPVQLVAVDANGNQIPVLVNADGSLAVGLVAESIEIGSVAIQPTVLVFVDASIAVTTGGVAQLLLAADVNRKGLAIYNNDTGTVWISFTSTVPTAGGPGTIPIGAGSGFELLGGWLSQQAIYVISQNSGAKVTCLKA